MVTPISTVAAPVLSTGEGRTPQPLNILGAGIRSLWLVQALCWFLVLFL
jgi:hypothetical protein